MKRLFFRVFVILLGCVLWHGIGNAKVIKNDYIVVGGKRVGPVMLGQPVAKYENFLGPRSTKSPRLFYYPARKMLLLVNRGKIEGITVFSPKYRTKKGVRIGQSVSILKKKYGNYLKTKAGSLVYTELGLSFLERNGKIFAIQVVHAKADPLLGDKKIIPGVRVGNIKIGMDISVIEKYWGKPARVERVKGKVLVYRYPHKAVSILVAEGIVAAVQINSYKFSTPEGISIGSTYNQVIKTYGKRFKQVNKSIFYNNLGIGFYFDKGKVLEILLQYRRE